MPYNHSGNWGNGNIENAELTWEEQNFMEEQEEGQKIKPDFSEYEWMMEQEEFDSQAKKRLEQDDDIDDMFYWDPSQGCTAGKSAAKNQQNVQEQQNVSQFQNNSQNTFQTASHSQPSTQFHPQSSPFTSNFQNSADLKQGLQFQKAPAQIHNNFQSSYQNPFQASQVQTQNQHFQVQKQEVQAGDELSRAMNGVDLNKFDLNPEANAFVPSWLKK